MRNNLIDCSLCETAAFRVQYWFGKDKNLFLYLHSPLPNQDKKYHYNLIKSLRIPFQTEALYLKEWERKKKKKHKTLSIHKNNRLKKLWFHLEDSFCSVNQKNINFILSQTKLSAARVAYLKLKEYFLVSRKLNGISKNPYYTTNKHYIVPIKTPPQETYSLQSNNFKKESIIETIRYPLP